MEWETVSQNLIELNAKIDLIFLFFKGTALIAAAAALLFWLYKSNPFARRAVRYFLGLFRRLYKKEDLPSPYLSVFGFVFMADGWGKISVEVMDALKGEFSIGFVQTRLKHSLADVPNDVRPILSRKNFPIGKVVLYTDCAWSTEKQPILDRLLKDPNAGDQIRIAYSMFESNKIPAFWVSIIHRYFDAVAVPDPYFIEVYKNSGIQRPVFSLPLCVNYSPFRSKPLKTKRRAPLVFADFSVFVPRKNHLTLIRAFFKAFNNQPDVHLKLHGRYAQGDWDQLLLEEIRKLGSTNVSLAKSSLPLKEYIELFQSVDCYVNLSKGEGFSIPPREAMMQGIPVICADNTALSTICNSGFVRRVPSLCMEPAYYHWTGKGYYGSFFNCTVEETAAALRDVYEHYDKYLLQAQSAREWAEAYDSRCLKPLYRSLVKPEKVLLGSENKIAADYLMTDSKDLFQKYL